eukprot:2974878-Rhodomonas_salina.2
MFVLRSIPRSSGLYEIPILKLLKPREWGRPYPATILIVLQTLFSFLGTALHLTGNSAILPTQTFLSVTTHHKTTQHNTSSTFRQSKLLINEGLRKGKHDLAFGSGRKARSTSPFQEASPCQIERVCCDSLRRVDSKEKMSGTVIEPARKGDLAGVKKWVEIDPWALQASDGGGSTAAHYAAKVALPLSYCAFILQCPKLLCLATQLPRDAQH